MTSIAGARRNGTEERGAQEGSVLRYDEHMILIQAQVTQP